MHYEKSCGAVIFYLKNGKPEFLLLEYAKGYFDFAKGHVEKNENELQTMEREVLEETGLKGLKIIKGFRKEISYFFKNEKRELVKKTVVFFLCESESQRVKISHEHKSFKWLSFDAALKQLNYGNSRKILNEAFEFLSKNKLV